MKSKNREQWMALAAMLLLVITVLGGIAIAYGGMTGLMILGSTFALCVMIWACLSYDDYQ